MFLVGSGFFVINTRTASVDRLAFRGFVPSLFVAIPRRDFFGLAPFDLGPRIIAEVNAEEPAAASTAALRMGGARHGENGENNH